MGQFPKNKTRTHFAHIHMYLKTLLLSFLVFIFHSLTYRHTYTYSHAHTHTIIELEQFTMFQTCKLKAHEIGGGGVEEWTKENCPVPMSGGGEVGETEIPPLELCTATEVKTSAS